MPGQTVLIVEKDEFLRVAMRHSLQRSGYSVLESGTGAKAKSLAAAHQPSLILMDLGLPDGDGLEVAQELRRGPKTSRIPIAVLIGEPVLGQRAELMANLCAGSIPKPVMLDRLERDLRLILSLARGRVPRRFRRYLVDIPAFYRRIGGDDDAGADYSSGMVRSLSEGGLSIELPNPLPMATLLHVRLQLSGGEACAGGKVVYARFRGDKKSENGFYIHGVQFTEIEPHTMDRLKPFMQSKASASR